MLLAMVSSSRPGWLAIWVLALLSACGAAKQAPPDDTATGAAASALPAPAPQAVAGLYSADEALRDVLSGPLHYVGTGPWLGVSRLQACVFRNERVVVVNAYCTLTDSHAFRIDVYSPTRGRVRIYAEGKGPVIAQTRQSYFTFTAESEPLPDPQLATRPLALTMSLQELRDYDQKRYEAFLPACYGGTELNRPRGGCLGALAPRASEWTNQHRGFLAQASDDWYRVMREMRALASKYGKEPARED